MITAFAQQMKHSNKFVLKNHSKESGSKNSFKEKISEFIDDKAKEAIGCEGKAEQFNVLFKGSVNEEIRKVE